MNPTHHRSVDLNADLGEATSPHDAAIEQEIMHHVSSVNIACGGHAGDPNTMRRLMALALDLGLAIGAHPSYPDRAGFGRTRIAMNPRTLHASIAEQIQLARTIAQSVGATLSHIKPHGALYHAADSDESIALVLFDAVRTQAPEAALVARAGGRALQWWQAWNCPTIAEAFIDRRYNVDGTLLDRSDPRALIADSSDAAHQAIELALHHRVPTIDQRHLSITADTLCLHADSPGSLDIARAARTALVAHDIHIGPPRQSRSSPD